MKKTIILLILTCFLLSVCLLPVTEIMAAQTYLRIEDFWNYSFNQYAANLPWQFQQHQMRYFNLYWVSKRESIRKSFQLLHSAGLYVNSIYG